MSFLFDALYFLIYYNYNILSRYSDGTTNTTAKRPKDSGFGWKTPNQT